MTYRSSCAAAWHRRWIVLARIALATPLAIAAAHAAAADWKPEGAIELIATNAPGGGSDRILRLMQKVIQEQGTTLPINVVNKPGGGSAIAYNYLNQHPGDARFRTVLDEDNVELTRFLEELGLVRKL